MILQNEEAIQVFPFKRFHNPDSVRRYKQTQLHIVKAIVQSNKKVIMLNAPTGVGKSIIGMMAGYRYKVDHINYICSDKMLQRQLLNDFKEAFLLMGRSNYTCNLYSQLKADSCISQCIEYKGDRKNDIAPTINCEYNDTKLEMLDSKFRILNTSYLLAESNFVGELSNQEFVIIDEADTLDSQLISFIQLQIYETQNKKCGLGYPKHITKVNDWVEWATEANNILDGLYPHPRAQHALHPEYKAVHTLQSKIDMFINEVDDDWTFEPGNKNGKVSSIFRPTWLTPEQTNKYLWSHAKKFLLMSATLPKKEIICKTLGLQSSDVDYIEVDCPFPIKNRKVIYRPIIEVTSKNEDHHFLVIDEIEKILKENSDVKGIIHSVSYKMANKIMDIHNDRLITHDSSNKDEVLKKFESSPEPLVLVSPSSARGLDAKNDMARFIIQPKVPYLNLGDKQIQKRVYGSRFGNNWYLSEAAQCIVQACGRGVRHQNDWCKNYILDKKFSNLMKFFPNWFREAIVIE